MTVVAICVLAIAGLMSAGPVSAVFGPPSGLQRDGQQIALELARHQCEQSLTKSIVKRTGTAEDMAAELAATRCGILLEGAPSTVTLVTPHDI